VDALRTVAAVGGGLERALSHSALSLRCTTVSSVRRLPRRIEARHRIQRRGVK
jgi:hypothetical protein